MNLETTITAWQLILAMGTTLVVSGIGLGSALQRIKTLEEKAVGWSGLDARLTRVETKVDGLHADVAEIKVDVKEALREIRSFSPQPRRP